MHVVTLLSVLVLCVNPIYSVTISTPPMQRKVIGESCQFRWRVTGNFTAYTVRFLTSSLGPNTNHSSSNGVITLLIWNIQISYAGYYSLSIATGPSTEVNSIVVLFVYSSPSASVVLSVGRNPSYAGDSVEINCSGTSNSMPVNERPKMYYFWYANWYGYLRNISSGPAVLQNGDVVPGYSIKNDGKTLVIASVQYSESFYCSVQEERSPYKSGFNRYVDITVYGKPRTYSFNPVSRKSIAALYSSVTLYFYYQTTTQLTSYTNWTFVNASGSTEEYPLGSNPLSSNQFYLYLTLSSVNLYGNYAVTLNNSYGSTTEILQILPPGPPDTPSNVSVQYMTNNRISLQWRCLWFNGAQQTVFVRLRDATTNRELDTRSILLAPSCYNVQYSTPFQGNIQPETSYEASIWSTNSYGSSNVTKFVLTTPKPVTFSVPPSNISILENEATINYLILNSNLTLIRLNVTCCVEITAECSNKSYILANTDNSILYDILPTGTEYVFDFVVSDTDGYTYEYILTILKGVRVSTVKTTEVTTPTTSIPYAIVFNGATPSDNPLLVPVIVLGVLLGVAVLVLVGCCIGFLVSKYRRNNSNQLTKTGRNSVPTENTQGELESPCVEDNYEPVVDVDRSKSNAYYKAPGGTPGNAKQFSEEWHTDQSYEPEGDFKQSPYMNPDEIFYTKPSGTLDRPKRNRYK